MRKLSRRFGTFLILVSLSIFAVLLYPLIKVYLFPPPYSLSAQPSNAFMLSIPKIKAMAPVIEYVDPWKQDYYNEVLKQGVAHAEGTFMPGEGKLTYLFAHSSGMPWEQLSYNTIFLRLGELEVGDEIILDRNNKRYRYVVTMKKEVWPNETRYLEDIDQNLLILQTCTPIGTTLKRLLVLATPIDS